MEFDKKGILARAKAAAQETAVMDEGLRAYMLKVYNYMATGILLPPSHCPETNCTYIQISISKFFVVHNGFIVIIFL